MFRGKKIGGTITHHWDETYSVSSCASPMVPWPSDLQQSHPITLTLTVLPTLPPVPRYDMEQAEIGAQERSRERESAQKKENLQKKEWDHQGKTQSLHPHTTNHVAAIHPPSFPTTSVFNAERRQGRVWYDGALIFGVMMNCCRRATLEQGKDASDGRQEALHACPCLKMID